MFEIAHHPDTPRRLAAAMMSTIDRLVVDVATKR